MLYEQAKQALAGGNRVRRPEWAEGQFVEMVNGDMFLGGVIWNPLNEDATAQNWEVEDGRNEATKAEKKAAAAFGAASLNPTDATGGPELQQEIEDMVAKRAHEKLQKQVDEQNKKSEEQAQESEAAADNPEEAKKQKVEKAKKNSEAAKKQTEKDLNDAKSAQEENEGSDSSKNDSIA